MATLILKMTKEEIVERYGKGPHGYIFCGDCPLYVHTNSFFDDPSYCKATNHGNFQCEGYENSIRTIQRCTATRNKINKKGV